jgi:hypothetical protein
VRDLVELLEASPSASLILFAALFVAVIVVPFVETKPG